MLSSLTSGPVLRSRSIAVFVVDRIIFGDIVVGRGEHVLHNMTELSVNQERVLFALVKSNGGKVGEGSIQVDRVRTLDFF